MGRITITIPRAQEQKLRKMGFKKTKGKRGGLSLIVQEALNEYIEKKSKPTESIRTT